MSRFEPANTPLLVFGGPYSNLEATQAIKAEAEKLRIPNSNVLCTGDLVAYCASPEETINLIREWGIAVVLGNCEESLGNDAADCGCGFAEGSTCDLLSSGWFNYSKPLISEANKSWMRNLPRNIEFNFQGRACLAIHGAVNQINQFIFASSDTQLKVSQLSETGADLIIGGHCGIPFGEKIGTKAWLNAGVIGMPANDGTHQTWYMLLTPQKDAVEISWHRLNYNNEKTAAKMAHAGLENGYKEALLTGLWPSTDVLPSCEKSNTGNALAVRPIVIS